MLLSPQRINQISEFAEEGINTCVTAFVVDIRFWASSLDEFTGMFSFARFPIPLPEPIIR